jgi:hypothetical protein
MKVILFLFFLFQCFNSQSIWTGFNDAYVYVMFANNGAFSFARSVPQLVPGSDVLVRAVSGQSNTFTLWLWIESTNPNARRIVSMQMIGSPNFAMGAIIPSSIPPVNGFWISSNGTAFGIFLLVIIIKKKK